MSSYSQLLVGIWGSVWTKFLKAISTPSIATSLRIVELRLRWTEPVSRSLMFGVLTVDDAGVLFSVFNHVNSSHVADTLWPDVFNKTNETLLFKLVSTANSDRKWTDSAERLQHQWADKGCLHSIPFAFSSPPVLWTSATYLLTSREPVNGRDADSSSWLIWLTNWKLRP